MPVFPEVGSTRTVFPGVAFPSRSSASIMATPIRSFTELAGLKYSSFAATTAPGAESFAIRLRRTRGVFPMSFVMSVAIRMAASLARVVPGSDLPVEGFALGAQAAHQLAEREAFDRRPGAPRPLPLPGRRRGGPGRPGPPRPGAARGRRTGRGRPRGASRGGPRRRDSPPFGRGRRRGAPPGRTGRGAGGPILAIGRGALPFRRRFGRFPGSIRSPPSPAIAFLCRGVKILKTPFNFTNIILRPISEMSRRLLFPAAALLLLAAAPASAQRREADARRRGGPPRRRRPSPEPHRPRRRADRPLGREHLGRAPREAPGQPARLLRRRPGTAGAGPSRSARASSSTRRGSS